jgi:DNA-binding response OmpR family regulator
VFEERESRPAMAVVLVAEDDDTERDLISFRLEQSGFQVRAYGTGAAVLEGLDADVVAVVLEERLPGLSGLDVCRALRHDPATVDIPVLMVSNSGAEEEALAAFAAGADDWLVEPLHVREFQARISGLLGRCRRHPHHQLA